MRREGGVNMDMYSRQHAHVIGRRSLSLRAPRSPGSGTTARLSARSPTVRPRGRRHALLRCDREAVGGESPVRPWGRRQGVPGTTERPSAGSPRYDREAVSNPSQTLSP